MPKNRPNNLYDRHQNKRALAKKQRAIAKVFGKLTDRSEASIQTDFVAEPNPELKQGIIIEIKSGIFNVLSDKQVIACKLEKTLPFELAGGLVVGDKVQLEFEDLNQEYLIKSRHPRKSFLARIRGDSTRPGFSESRHVVAANIDLGIIVASAKNPTFHSGLIDRYLVLCQNGAVKPIICVNKADLTSERDPIIDYYKRQLHLNVLEISALTGLGIKQLRRLLYDRISVLVGNSGVGKTSIINALTELELKTQEVSQKNQQGRHTTTSSSLYQLDSQTFIIDTPGI